MMIRAFEKQLIATKISELRQIDDPNSQTFLSYSCADEIQNGESFKRL